MTLTVEYLNYSDADAVQFSKILWVISAKENLTLGYSVIDKNITKGENVTFFPIG